MRIYIHFLTLITLMESLNPIVNVNAPMKTVHLRESFILSVVWGLVDSLPKINNMNETKIHQILAILEFSLNIQGGGKERR